MDRGGTRPARPVRAPLAVLVPLLLLAACQKSDNEPGPGGVTMGEARALDRAAEKVEAEAPPEPEPSASGG